MQFKRYAILYAAAAAGAIYLLFGTFANDPAPNAAPTHLSGEMRKLIFHPSPKPFTTVAFTDPSGQAHTMAEYRGKYVMVNMWATWCPPCRKEMPSINRLQQKLGGDDFAVVTIATGRNTLPGIRKFFESAGVTDLPILLDPKQTMARDMGVLGLPVSVILNREGQEIARLTGDAEWDSEAALAVIGGLIGDGVGG